MSLKQNAKDVLALLERGQYVTKSGQTVSLARAQEEAVAGTRLYAPEQITALLASAPMGRSTPAIALTAETTQVAAARLSTGDTRVAILNFASARNPGGGLPQRREGTGGRPLPLLRALPHPAHAA